jgi:uncharacterized protein YdhG (YjbR/CyaY superfamily)
MVRAVRSDASTVEEYVAEAPAERRNALELLRRLCREELSGFDEEMAYGMPAYLRDGVVEVGFASQKAYISLYILRQDALDAGAERLAGLSLGKGCVRFARPEQVDPAVVRELLKAAATDSGPLC